MTFLLPFLGALGLLWLLVGLLNLICFFARIPLYILRRWDELELSVKFLTLVVLVIAWPFRPCNIVCRLGICKPENKES